PEGYITNYQTFENITLFLKVNRHLCMAMDIEQIQQIANIISKGDTGAVEGLFNKPGGRKFLERIVLMLLCNTTPEQEDKEDVFVAFCKGLDKIEQRITRQKEGQKIIAQIYF
ncbi:MAG: hypothetical protein M3040_11570, partial [Bacteroidota bacterium]|nr:hypothetical protein [Bacteroidota bacterium]